MFSNKELLEEINKWRTILSTPGNEHLYELAFFKIFVKFEKFLSLSFIKYSIGVKSEKKFRPRRKLFFKDEKHLFDTLTTSGEKKYIDYCKLIERISMQIFSTNDPFYKIFSDSVFKDNFLFMKRIRDYIAHESEEAKNTYFQKVLKSNSCSTFVEPIVFLRKLKKKEGKIYYSYFIDVIVKYSTIILKPPK